MHFGRGLKKPLHTTNEKLTQALTYSTNQRNGLETFLEDGRIPLSNNLCEANIKPFATARRAGLQRNIRNASKNDSIRVTQKNLFAHDSIF